MTALLDTQAFLWFWLGDGRCSAAARGTIEDSATDLLLSPATYWEIAIKVSLGKYFLAGDFEQTFARAIREVGVRVVPITPSHAAVVSGLPFHHRDPFDRLMIAQALAEKAKAISADAAWDAYGVERVW